MSLKYEKQTKFTDEQLTEAWERKPHDCSYHDGNGCYGYCEEEDGKLNLVVSDNCEAQGMFVPYCPFCGYRIPFKRNFKCDGCDKPAPDKDCKTQREEYYKQCNPSLE